MTIGKTEYLGAFFSVAVLSVSTAQAVPPEEAINTLGQLQCLAGEAALYDGTKWVCSDITTRLDALEAELDALETENQALKDRLACVTSTSNATDFVFEGCNVHVRNGVGQTDSINGAGNLIVGYDEERLPQNSSCSLGRYWDTQTDCEAAGGTWWVNNKTGSHNVVIGPEHNYSSYSGFVAGEENTISSEHASVSGGVKNTASVPWSSVSGGANNTASGGRNTSVSGGASNTALRENSSVSGGQRNIASGASSSVSGGADNNASSINTSVSGGAGCELDLENGWGVGDTDSATTGCVNTNAPSP